MQLHLEDAINVASALIGAAASITNALSLSYFIRKVKWTLSNKIFILLNVWDLLVSLIHVVALIFLNCRGNQDTCGRDGRPFKVSIAMSDVTVEGTAFATCLLSVTRAISLVIPFYRIKKLGVWIATAVFSFQSVLKISSRLYIDEMYADERYYYYIKLEGYSVVIILSVVIIVNITSSLLSAWKLFARRKVRQNALVNDHGCANHVADTNRKATITIMIVSVLFCFFNSLFAYSIYVIYINPGYPPDPLETPVLSLLFFYFSAFLTLPLNSAINPLIYFLRKEDMRRYLRDLLAF